VGKEYRVRGTIYQYLRKRVGHIIIVILRCDLSDRHK